LSPKKGKKWCNGSERGARKIGRKLGGSTGPNMTPSKRGAEERGSRKR